MIVCFQTKKKRTGIILLPQYSPMRLRELC